MKLIEFANPINKQLPDFVKFACEQLGITKHPRIDVVDTVPGAEGVTFGKYAPEDGTIYIVAKNRHPRDVFRTLAHEMVHYKQDQENRLKQHSGATGSHEENEANAKAGVVMRNYNHENPEEPVDEHIVKHGSGYRLLSKKGKNLGTFKSKAAAAKHEGEVEWFKAHPKK
jgi:Zn-dependent peptidase ImmA (M78 family)